MIPRSWAARSQRRPEGGTLLWGGDTLRTEIHSSPLSELCWVTSSRLGLIQKTI